MDRHTLTRERCSNKSLCPDVGDDECSHAAQQCQNNRFCQQLTHNASTRTSQRCTHGQLCFLAHTAHHQQIRNVGAGNQKHKT